MDPDLKGIIGFIAGLVPVLGVLIYFKLNFALENTHIRANPLKQLGTYLLEVDRYIIVSTKFINKFFAFNDGIVWLMAGYMLISGLDRSDLFKKRALSPAILLLLMMGSYFFIYVIYLQISGNTHLAVK